jgi:hypothetical protein
MPPMGFEPAIPESERPQTHALDRVATGTGLETIRCDKKIKSQNIVRKVNYSGDGSNRIITY